MLDAYRSSKHLSFKMEGACGKIVPMGLTKVKKIIYRKAGKQRRIKSLRAYDQWRIQIWAHRQCQWLRGYKILRVPEAYDVFEHAYVMDRIEADKQMEIDEIKRDSELMADLRRFYDTCQKEGLYPMDFELYRQSDGSVAMVDFDKFGSWCADGSVAFPFGMTWSPQQVKDNTWILQ